MVQESDAILRWCAENSAMLVQTSRIQISGSASIGYSGILNFLSRFPHHWRGLHTGTQPGLKQKYLLDELLIKFINSGSLCVTGVYDGVKVVNILE